MKSKEMKGKEKKKKNGIKKRWQDVPLHTRCSSSQSKGRGVGVGIFITLTNLQRTIDFVGHLVGTNFGTRAAWIPTLHRFIPTARDQHPVASCILGTLCTLCMIPEIRTCVCIEVISLNTFIFQKKKRIKNLEMRKASKYTHVKNRRRNFGGIFDRIAELPVQATHGNVLSIAFYVERATKKKEKKITSIQATTVALVWTFNLMTSAHMPASKSKQVVHNLW